MQNTDNQRTTAIGLARYAYEYIDAAIIVDEEKAEDKAYAIVSYTPAYFLIVHGIELTLKAYLMQKGIDIETLRSKEFGHDLDKCLEKANKLGFEKIFVMTDADKQAYELLIEINKEHQLRYIQTGFKRYPLWSIVEPLAVRMHQAVAKEVGIKSFTKSYIDY